MIARGRRNASRASVDVAFHAGDMTALAAELGTYDRVYSTMTFHHLCPAAAARTSRLVRPRG